MNKTTFLSIILMQFSIFNLYGQTKDCQIRKTKNFEEFKIVYSNILSDLNKENFENRNSENNVEIVLLRKPDRFTDELIVFVKRNNKTFAYKKNSSSTEYINLQEHDIDLITQNIQLVEDNFFGNLCGNPSTHPEINILIVKKNGKIMSGYFTSQIFNKSGNDYQDLTSLRKIMEILFKYYF